MLPPYTTAARISDKKVDENENSNRYEGKANRRYEDVVVALEIRPELRT